VEKLSHLAQETRGSRSLAQADPEIFAAIEQEAKRQFREYRADRVGEFHEPRRDGGAGLLPHEQSTPKVIPGSAGMVAANTSM
jgi:hypothetical protein